MHPILTSVRQKPCLLEVTRTTRRMSRKLQRSGRRLFVILYCGEYWIYRPHPVYETMGHKPIRNLGPVKRAAWDKIADLLERPEAEFL